MSEYIKRPEAWRGNLPRYAARVYWEDGGLRLLHTNTGAVYVRDSRGLYTVCLYLEKLKEASKNEN